jgi:hypothetical protein
VIGRILQQKRTQPNAGGQVAGQVPGQQMQAPTAQQAASAGGQPIMNRGGGIARAHGGPMYEDNNNVPTPRQYSQHLRDTFPPAKVQPVVLVPMTNRAAAPPEPANERANGGIARRDAGGGMAGVPLSMADPWWTRQDAYSEQRGGGSGFLSGASMGRADAIRTSAPAGSYVLPADVVAGLGDGNSMAGAKVMDRILATGPHGTPLPRPSRGMGIPRPPRPMPYEAKGGGVQGSGSGATAVALSHGEYVLAPHHVIRIGHGSLSRGHKILDKLVLELRRRNIEKLKRLPGPVRAAA